MTPSEKLSDAKTDEERNSLKSKVKDSFKEHENAFRCGLCKSAFISFFSRCRGQRCDLQ